MFYLQFKLFPLFFPPSKPAKPVSSLSLLCIKANTGLQTVTRPECPLLGKAVLWHFLACRCAVYLGGAACGPAHDYCLQSEWEEWGKEQLGWEDQNDLEIVSFFFFFPPHLFERALGEGQSEREKQQTPG